MEWKDKKMNKETDSKKYWFIKRGHTGQGFAALVGYPNTWQGFLFWAIILLSLRFLPALVEERINLKGLGAVVFISIVMLVWFPVTAIKTKYVLEDDSDNIE